MNQDGKVSGGYNFIWSNNVGPGYVVPVKTLSPGIKIIEAAPRYFLTKAPAVRKPNNISIKYTINLTGNGKTVAHTECIDYAVNWCGDGLVDTRIDPATGKAYEQCDPADPAKTGWGKGGCDASCKPTDTGVPVCNPAKSGAQTTPVASTDTLCTTGTASAFASSQNGTTTNYTWSCNNTTSVNCSASYTPAAPQTFDLKIKKYAKSEDIFASVEKTEAFNYNIVVENVGPGKVSNTTTVQDKLPPNVTLRATPSGNGWTCTGGVGDTAFSCTTTAQVAAHQLFDVITVPVGVKDLVFRKDGYVNYAYVHNPDEMTGKKCNANGSMPNPALAGDNGQDPTKVCNEDKNNFDPATINPPNPDGFDLRLKKFVNGDDESASVNTDGTVTYTFSVQNLGEMASSGKTTVSDSSFPDGITIASIATTQGEWSCIKDSSTKFTCTTDKSYKKGEFATMITLTANIPTGLTVGAHRNVACLSNPYDPNENEVLDPSIGKYKVNNCDPAEVRRVDPTSFDLMIKKYVADLTTGTPERDGDHQTTNDGTDVDRDILTVPQGGKMRYRFAVKNLGPATATGITTVEDTLPNDTTITSVAGNGWSCTTTETRKFKCTRSDGLAAGASFPEIVVTVQASNTILAGEYSNVATVKNNGDTNPDNNTDPANIEIVVPGLDLQLKKFIDNVNVDAQPGNAVSKNTGDTFNYIIRVQNVSTVTASGETIVRDKLPTGVEINGIPEGASWTGSYNATTRIVEMKTTQQVGSGAYFTLINIPVKVTATAGQSVTNYAVVYNKDEIYPCKLDDSMPVGDETSCNDDEKNIDPAVISVPGTTTGSSYVGKKCVNNAAVCATYNSFEGCVSDLKSVGFTDTDARNKCYPSDATGMNKCQTESLTCT